MCAISGKGLFCETGSTSQEILRMTKELNHRGPDDSGVFISKKRNVGLGNNRLAIIDLSKNGHQPMNYRNRYTITFNGEIYNFQEEKRKLIKLGYQFISNTDTEVILALYSKFGRNVLTI